jgi:dihydrofolate reductase
MILGGPDRLKRRMQRPKEETMGRIVVTEFVTLDGVMEDPGGGEDFERGGWAFQFERGPDGDAFKLEELQAADAMLLGRRTYEGFAKAWPSMTDDVGFAEKMNSMPKVVVSSTLDDPEWTNSRVVDGDLGEIVAALKAEHGGDVLVAGSAQLVHELASRDLVDEYRLMVYPVVLGAGKQLFGDGDAPVPLQVVETRPSGAVVLLRLARAEAA